MNVGWHRRAFGRIDSISLISPALPTAVFPCLSVQSMVIVPQILLMTAGVSQA
jgi:hypothetical protein